MRRATRSFLSPLFTAFLCLCLAFPPNSAYALREPNPLEGLQRAGLEHTLASGLEESSGTHAVDSEGLTRELSGLHGKLARGEPIPNRIVWSNLDRTGLKSWFRNTLGPQAGNFALCFPTVFHFVPPLPAPHCLNQPHGYSAALDTQGLTALMQARNEAFPLFYGLFVAERDEPAKPPTNPADRLSSILTAGNQALIFSLSSMHEDPGQVRQQAERLSVLYESSFRLSEAVSGAREKLGKRQKIPVGEIRRILTDLLPFAKDWGWLELGFQMRIASLPAEGKYPANELHLFLKDIPPGARIADARRTLQGTGTDRTYLAAYRTLLLKKGRDLAKRVRGLDLKPDASSMARLRSEVFWFSGHLCAIETEGVFRDAVSSAAQSVSTAQGPPPEPLAPFGPLGIVFVDGQGRMRFAPGGWAFAPAGRFSGRFILDAVRQARRPEDRMIVLVYSSAGGVNLEAVISFWEESYYFQEAFPGVQVVLGMARPDGSLQVYRIDLPNNDPAPRISFFENLDPFAKRYWAFRDSMRELFCEGGEQLPPEVVLGISSGYPDVLRNRLTGRAQDLWGIERKPGPPALGADGQLLVYDEAGAERIVDLVGDRLGPLPSTDDRRVLTAYAQRVVELVGEHLAAELRAQNPNLASQITFPPDPASFPPPAVVSRENFSALLQRILDLGEGVGHSDQEGRQLLLELLGYFEEDEKPGAPETPESPLRRLALQAYGDFEGRSFPVSQMIAKVPSLKNPSIVAKSLAAVINRVWRLGTEDLDLGPPATPEPLEEGQTLEECLRRLRQWLQAACREENSLAMPSRSLGSLDPSRLEMNRPVDFGIYPVLAARQLGFGPATASFPELVRAMLDNGVKQVLFIPPVSGDGRERGNPPSLWIEFERPWSDPFDGRLLPGVQVALLKKVWQSPPPLPEQPLEGIPEEELNRQAAVSMAADLNQVEFDPEKVRDYAFDPETPPEQKYSRLAELLLTAFQGDLVLRGPYLVSNHEEALRRFSRWVGRNAESRTALWEYAVLRWAKMLKQIEQGIKIRGNLLYYPEEELTQLKARVDGIVLLHGLGVAELMRAPEALKRAATVIDKVRGKGRRFPLLDQSHYLLPLLALVFAREGEAWVLGDADVITFLNRLTQKKLFQNESVIGAVSGLAESFGSEAAAAFLAELCFALLRQIPLNPARPFRTATMEQALRALAGMNLRILGPGAAQAPTARRLRAADAQ